MSHNLLIFLPDPEHETFPMGGTLAKYTGNHTEIAYLPVCHPEPLGSDGSGCVG
jgi:hypothetical protein